MSVNVKNPTWGQMVIENKQIMSKNLLFIKAKSQISLEQHSTVMYIVNVNNYTLPPNRSKTNRIRTKKQTENHMVDFLHPVIIYNALRLVQGLWALKYTEVPQVTWHFHQG